MLAVEEIKGTLQLRCIIPAGVFMDLDEGRLFGCVSMSHE